MLGLVELASFTTIAAIIMLTEQGMSLELLRELMS